MITRDEVLARSAAADDRYPLLTLDEFFTGNVPQHAIAPNQQGLGRPDIAEIGQRLRWLEAHDDVSWVRVQPHEQMFEDDADGVEAESVAICTSLPEETVDELLNVEELQAEPVWEGLSYDADQYCDVPAVPDGHRILTLVWD